MKASREMMGIVLLVLWAVWMAVITAQYAWMIYSVKFPSQ